MKKGELKKEQLVAIMKGSKNESEWRANCRKIKKICGGFLPGIWLTAIVASNLFKEVRSSWT